MGIIFPIKSEWNSQGIRIIDFWNKEKRIEMGKASKVIMNRKIF